MSIHMDVRVDNVLEEGAYQAVVERLEQKDTIYGERLMWTFDIPEHDVKVVGFTSMSPSTKARAYQWATAVMGEIDPKTGWGAEDVIGGECTVVLKVAKDAQGVEKNKVVGVKAPEKGEAKSENGEASDEPDFDQIPF